MLKLTRKSGQEIVIHHGGQVLRVIIGRVKGGATELVFDGPRTFAIVRDDAKHREPPARG